MIQQLVGDLMKQTYLNYYYNPFYLGVGNMSCFIELILKSPRVQHHTEK